MARADAQAGSLCIPLSRFIASPSRALYRHRAASRWVRRCRSWLQSMRRGNSRRKVGVLARFMGRLACSVQVMGFANKGRGRLPAPCSCFCKTILSGPSSSGHATTWRWHAFRSSCLSAMSGPLVAEKGEAQDVKQRNHWMFSRGNEELPPSQPARKERPFIPVLERTGMNGPFSVKEDGESKSHPVIGWIEAEQPQHCLVRK